MAKVNLFLMIFFYAPVLIVCTFLYFRYIVPPADVYLSTSDNSAQEEQIITQDWTVAIINILVILYLMAKNEILSDIVRAKSPHC